MNDGEQDRLEQLIDFSQIKFDEYKFNDSTLDLLTNEEIKFQIFIKKPAAFAESYIVTLNELSSPKPNLNQAEEFFGTDYEHWGNCLLPELGLIKEIPLGEQGNFCEISLVTLYDMIANTKYEFSFSDSNIIYFKDLSVILNLNQGRFDSAEMSAEKLIKHLLSFNLSAVFKKSAFIGISKLNQRKFFEHFSVLKCSHPSSRFLNNVKTPSNELLFCFRNGSDDDTQYLFLAETTVHGIGDTLTKEKGEVEFERVYGIKKATSFLQDYNNFIIHEIVRKFQRDEIKVVSLFKSSFFGILFLSLLTSIALGLLMPFHFLINLSIVWIAQYLYGKVVKKLL